MQFLEWKIWYINSSLIFLIDGPTDICLVTCHLLHQHWCSKWHVTKHMTRHYLNQCRQRPLTMPGSVNYEINFFRYIHLNCTVYLVHLYSLHFVIPPPNEVGGGILESHCFCCVFMLIDFIHIPQDYFTVTGAVIQYYCPVRVKQPWRI